MLLGQEWKLRDSKEAIGIILVQDNSDLAHGGSMEVMKSGQILDIFKKLESLGWVAQLVRALFWNAKDAGVIPSQSTCQVQQMNA